MKHFIATFDIESAPGEPHQRFVESAMRRGWHNTLTVNGQTERLPTASLIGEFSDLDQAYRSFDKAISDASAAISPATINVERRFIVERLPAGRLKATKKEWIKTNIARINKLLRPKSSPA